MCRERGGDGLRGHIPRAEGGALGRIYLEPGSPGWALHPGSWCPPPRDHPGKEVLAPGTWRVQGWSSGPGPGRVGSPDPRTVTGRGRRRGCKALPSGERSPAAPLRSLVGSAEPGSSLGSPSLRAPGDREEQRGSLHLLEAILPRLRGTPGLGARRS